MNPQFFLFNPMWLLAIRQRSWLHHIQVQRGILLLWLVYGCWLIGKAHWMLMLPWWLGIGWVGYQYYRQYPELLPFVKQNRV